jgi:NADPH:quinone reductase-like Zn-dependent oxidoreductase
MKAVYLTAYGRNAKNLEVRDVPEPAEPGAEDAVVAVEFAPINFNDLMVLWGTFPWKPETPSVIGNEGSGIVRKVGSAVTNVKPGDRVVLPLMSGSWRQLLTVPASSLARVPLEADAKQAALLGINATSASILLSDFVELKPGDAIVHNAATSGLSRWLVALARQRGLKTIGLIRRDDVASAIRETGCDFIVPDSESVPDAQQRLGGLDVKLGLDVLGGAASGRVLEFISPGGKLVNYGSITEKPMELSGATLTFKRVAVEGFFLGFPDQAAKAHGILPELGKLLASDKIEQPIAAVYPIDRTREAVEHAQKGGRVLIDIQAD